MKTIWHNTQKYIELRREEAKIEMRVDAVVLQLAPSNDLASRIEQRIGWEYSLCAGLIRVSAIQKVDTTGAPSKVQTIIENQWKKAAANFATAFEECKKANKRQFLPETLRDIAKMANQAYQNTSRQGKAEKWVGISDGLSKVLEPILEDLSRLDKSEFHLKLDALPELLVKW